MPDAALVTVFDADAGQGGGLVRAILADGRRRWRVRAVVRRLDQPQARALRRRGVEVAEVDPLCLRRTTQALDGAHAAFFATDGASADSPDAQLAQAQVMAEAAARAGIAQAIWSTFEDTRNYLPADGSRMPLLAGGYNVPRFDIRGEANRFFIARGVPTTLLYTSICWEELVLQAGLLTRGSDCRWTFVLPMGDAKLPGIAAEDVGRCAFGIFTRGDELAGKAIGIAGEHLSGAQMAEHLTSAIGEPVIHGRLAPDELRARGDRCAQELANTFQFMRDFEHELRDARSVDVTRELNAGLMSFAQWLRWSVRPPLQQLSFCDRRRRAPSI